MPRTIIELPVTQLHDLDARCESLGISRAEGVRRAVEGFLRQTAMVGAFGMWNGTLEITRREDAVDERA